MKYPGKLSIFIILAAVGSLALSACGGNAAIGTPTAAAIETSAVGTFAAGLTQTFLSLPTDTPTATPTFTPTTTPTRSTPLATMTGAVTATISCYGLTLVSDVTIPDNTAMNPGQTFTKTWQVKNTGTCNWDAGFKFVFISGDSMGGIPLVLVTPVSPGGLMDISIAMTAPSKAGAVRGHWRMSTASGALFGADVFVAIIVGNSTSTPTATVTGTPGAATATATFTPSSTP
ncbi:MAG: NBR1-Ig-like domain-containing protein [Anaerolineales bacterium]